MNDTDFLIFSIIFWTPVIVFFILFTRWFWISTDVKVKDFTDTLHGFLYPKRPTS